MLVINRKSNESIIIGDNIEIIVSSVDGDRVKLCINAPKDVPLMRKELLEAKKVNVQAQNNLEQNREMIKNVSKSFKFNKGE